MLCRQFAGLVHRSLVGVIHCPCQRFVRRVVRRIDHERSQVYRLTLINRRGRTYEGDVRQFDGRRDEVNTDGFRSLHRIFLCVQRQVCQACIYAACLGAVAFIAHGHGSARAVAAVRYIKQIRIGAFDVPDDIILQMLRGIMYRHFCRLAEFYVAEDHICYLQFRLYVMRRAGFLVELNRAPLRILVGFETPCIELHRKTLLVVRP